MNRFEKQAFITVATWLQVDSTESLMPLVSTVAAALKTEHENTVNLMSPVQMDTVLQGAVKEDGSSFTNDWQCAQDQYDAPPYSKDTDPKYASQQQMAEERRIFESDDQGSEWWDYDDDNVVDWGELTEDEQAFFKSDDDWGDVEDGEAIDLDDRIDSSLDLDQDIKPSWMVLEDHKCNEADAQYGMDKEYFAELEASQAKFRSENEWDGYRWNKKPDFDPNSSAGS